MTSGRVAHPARRVDLRVVAGLFLLLAALGGGMFFWQSVDESTAVLVYARDVPAGATIQASDLTAVSFAVPPALADVVVPAADEGRLVGKVASEPVHAGALVQEAQLQGRPTVPSGGGIVALPVTSTSAAGGRVQIGDHVRVVATWNRGRDDARTQTILPDAVVEDVARPPSGGLGSSAAGDTTLTSVSVVVTDSTQMEQLVAAKEDAALDLIWLAPNAPSGTGAPVVPTAAPSVPRPTPPPASTPVG